MLKKASCIFILSFLYSIKMLAQSDALEIIIQQFLQQGNVAKLYDSKMRIASLNYELSKVPYQWQVGLASNTPYSNSIQSVVQNDGRINYVNRRYFNPDISVAASRQLTRTGGTIGISNSFGLIQNLGFAQQQWNTNWLNLSINQPLFQFNGIKFDIAQARIQKTSAEWQNVQQRESTLQSFMEMYLQWQALHVQYDLLLQQADGMLKQKARTILLFNAGKVLATDTLQQTLVIENNKLQRSIMRTDLASMQSFLQKRCARLTLESSAVAFAFYDIDETTLTHAFMQNEQRLTLAADSLRSATAVARTKHHQGLTAGVNAGVGANQSATQFQGLFSQPSSMQNITLSVKVPLTQWKTLAQQQELAALDAEIQKLNLNEKQLLAHEWAIKQVNEYNKLKQQLLLVQQQISTTSEVYRINQIKYDAGRLQVAELISLSKQISELELQKLQICIQSHNLRFAIRAQVLYDVRLNKYCTII
jgi:outer membrane protein TolC